MIKSKDISVVVQGPINRFETKKCLKSIRKYLPDSEIILSTWEDSDVKDLDYDVLIENKDPGTTQTGTHHNLPTYNNLNRQLLSTQEGLKKCSRKYVLKLRSDFILSSNKFLNYFDKFSNRNEKYVLFKNKIITSCLVSRFTIKHQNEQIPIPFHISDWWFFGLKQDIETYFLGTPLVVEPEFSNYFSIKENFNKKTPYNKVKFKFAPEQYFAYECFNRHFDVHMEDASDVNTEIIEKSRKLIINNFIILEYNHSGIYTNKYSYSKNESFSGEQYIGLYNFYRYELEYKKYCDKNYKTTANNSFLKNTKLGYATMRLQKHLWTLMDKNGSFLTKLEQLFIGIPYSIINLIFLLIFNRYKKEDIQNEYDN